MRASLFLIFSLLLVLSARAASPQPAASVPAAAPKLLQADSAGFSAVIPDDWAIRSVPHAAYPMAYGPVTDGITANLGVDVERFAGTLNAFVDANVTSFQQNLVAFKLIQREDFVCTSGIKAVKLTTQNLQFGTNLLQVFYFFPGPDQRFILLTGTASAKSADKITADFDAVAKTAVLANAK